jgi:hypothetical protein
MEQEDALVTDTTDTPDLPGSRFLAAVRAYRAGTIGFDGVLAAVDAYLQTPVRHVRDESDDSYVFPQPGTGHEIIAAEQDDLLTMDEANEAAAWLARDD